MNKSYFYINAILPMKKLLLVVPIILISFCCQAQNWQCVNSGELRYFINDDNYLRGMRIDSVKQDGADSILYTFRSHRGWIYNPHWGGSWLGDKIILKQDGTHLFINAWNDTITIKSHAILNESWILNTDTLDVFFVASITAIDTMTILGVLDSVKTITIMAKQHYPQ
jgi:hypothetical protein